MGSTDGTFARVYRDPGARPPTSAELHEAKIRRWIAEAHTALSAALRRQTLGARPSGAVALLRRELKRLRLKLEELSSLNQTLQCMETTIPTAHSGAARALRLRLDRRRPRGAPFCFTERRMVDPVRDRVSKEVPGPGAHSPSPAMVSGFALSLGGGDGSLPRSARPELRLLEGSRTGGLFVRDDSTPGPGAYSPPLVPPIGTPAWMYSRSPRRPSPLARSGAATHRPATKLGSSPRQLPSLAGPGDAGEKQATPRGGGLGGGRKEGGTDESTRSTLSAELPGAADDSAAARALRERGPAPTAGQRHAEAPHHRTRGARLERERQDVARLDDWRARAAIASPLPRTLADTASDSEDEADGHPTGPALPRARLVHPRDAFGSVRWQVGSGMAR